MKIQYYGTAAYEGIPSLFCQCETCRIARERGGKNIRTRAQALIDDKILIDFGPDTVAHNLRFAPDWNRITHCLITHSHSDHFYPEDAEMSGPGYAAGIRTKLHYYADRAAYDRLAASFDNHPERFAETADATRVTVGDPFSFDGYTALAVRANHAPDTTPVVYALTDGKKRMLYAHDTGLLSDESKATLAIFGRFDFVSLDCTGAFKPGWVNGHMCLETCLGVVKEMKETGMADDRTIFVVNHFSHNGGALHEEMEQAMAPHGILVAYDGMTVEF